MDQSDARRTIGKAIRADLDTAGRSQSWLGAEVAAIEGRADPYSQPHVSDWLSGTTDIPPGRLFIIEQVLGKRPGTYSRIVGYLPVGARSVTTVLDAIEADTRLSAEGRHTVAEAYRAALAFSTQRAG